MIAGLPAALVDTNVLVYTCDPRDPAKQAQAIDVLQSLASASRGALSAQVLGEFFVRVMRIPMPLSRAEAEQAVTYLARFMPAYDITPLAVLEAIRAAGRHSLSYWDALIWATAKLNGVPNVLSEDFSDGALIEGVRFLNPFAEHFDLSALARA
jgi:predicted nucleic acid-binding protein